MWSLSREDNCSLLCGVRITRRLLLLLLLLVASKGGEQQLWQPPAGDADDHPVAGTLKTLAYWLLTQLFNFWGSYKVVDSESFNFYFLGFTVEAKKLETR